MIPLKDDNPTQNKPIVRNYIIAACVIIFFMQLINPSYKTGELFYSYGLIPSVLTGLDQLPQDLYGYSSLYDYFNVNVYARWIYASDRQYALYVDFCR